VLGVTGGIAAYKAADLASKLVQLGASISVIMTESATRFVGALTFEAITQQPVHTSVFESWREVWHGHISLGQNADVIVIAPATASTLARLAHGLADDMLGAAVLSARCPVIIAPAMEDAMYRHAATQANLQLLRDRGVIQVGPEEGRLASGEIGVGRLAEPQVICGAVRQALGRQGLMAGRKVVVTAGGTREPIDPIRFIGNRSSGLMGYALAQAAIDAGAEVTLITGETCLEPPYGVNLVDADTVEIMEMAVADAVRGADVLLMSAALSDYRPEERRTQKLKKDAIGETMAFGLVANPDVLAGVDEPGLIKIGFAAETESLVENARRKLAVKSLDMIVANDAEATIGNLNSQAVIIAADGSIESLDEMPKQELAEIIIKRAAQLLEVRSPQEP
jgi:phosphopantothenoylcysteine decarboxylase/phosphopantothenate--cysteine ligase